MAEITNNIPHTTYDFVEDSFEGSTITVTCDAEYTFVSAPTYTGENGYGDSISGAMAVDASNKVATVTLQNFYGSFAAATLSGETTGGTTPPEPQPPTVTNNVENTTEEHTYESGILNVTLHTADPYAIKDATITYISGGFQTTKSLVISEDGKTATIQVEADTDTEVTINGNTGEYSPVENYLSNCVVSGLKPYYFSDDVVNVTITANDGAIFKGNENPPHVEYHADDGTGLIVTKTKTFTISEDGKTATLQMNMAEVAEGYILTFSGGAVVEEPISKNYGAVNVYIVTDDILDAFAKVRFITGNGTNTENVDLGVYVNKLRRIYTHIENGASDVIKCGNYDTQIGAYSPQSDIITLDFGEITIPKHNNDTTDYNGEIKVFLPFAGFVDIPTDYIGKTIKVVYNIQVINGDGVALLSCDGNVFHVEEITPYDDMIYLTATDKQIGGDTWRANRLRGTQPYIYNKWFTSASGGINNDRKRVQIGDVTGFCRFDDIEPIHTTEMLTEEQETIYRLLQSGVYVE